ncbi:hypothetical protein N8554_00395 [Akkermansiaceae bacterium]|nr:hypothetical protein [Akkermansiaceae bacterium]
MKEEADEAIVELSLEHPELGSDKVGRLVRNRGLRVSSERVREVRRDECLQVPPPKKKQSRRGVLYWAASHKGPIPRPCLDVGFHP